MSAQEPGGRAWQLEFERLRSSLNRTRPADAGVVPGLLGLAWAHEEHRGDYLALVEACLRRRVFDEPALTATWHDLRENYPSLRECIGRNANPGARAAAARLLSAFAEETSLNRQAIDWALRRETDPDSAAVMLASLHSLRWAETNWPQVLGQFQTGLNHATVRFQAACCRLEAERAAAPEVLAELRDQLYSADGQAAPALRAIVAYGARLPRVAAVELWCGLLRAAEEFDGAAEMACRLLRAATGDRREGWDRVVLTSRTAAGEEAPPPGVLASVARLAYAGLFQKLTGRKAFLPLPVGQVPSREYPEVRAFPPLMDLEDPLARQALGALAGCDPLWLGRTELWRLFGLPESRLELRILMDEFG